MRRSSRNHAMGAPLPGRPRSPNDRRCPSNPNDRGGPKGPCNLGSPHGLGNLCRLNGLNSLCSLRFSTSFSLLEAAPAAGENAAPCELKAHDLPGALRTPFRLWLSAVRSCDPAPGAARRKRASCQLSPKTLRRGQISPICESRWLSASFSQSARMRKPSSQHTACRVAFFLVVSRLTYRRFLSTTSGNRAERDFSRWLPNLVRIERS